MPKHDNNLEITRDMPENAFTKICKSMKPGESISFLDKGCEEMSGDSIDLISTIKELEEMQPELRATGEYRKANMLDFAINYLNKYRRSIQDKRMFGENCDQEK